MTSGQKIPLVTIPIKEIPTSIRTFAVQAENGMADKYGSRSAIFYIRPAEATGVLEGAETVWLIYKER